MVHVGAKNETVGSTRSGSPLRAHDVRRLKERARRIHAAYREARRLRQRGNRAGHRRTTSKQCRRARWNTTLWLESDRLASLGNALTQERFDNQKSVVENERRERQEDQPYGLVDTVLRESLYPAGHPYGHSVMGVPHELRATTLTDAKDFFSTFYAPNNISMTIAGDFDSTTVKEWIAKYFGPIRPAQTLLRPVRWVPHLDAEKVVDVRDHVAEERTYFVWPAAGWVSSDTLALEAAARVLNRRLSADLVYAERPWCSDESVDLNTLEDASEFVVMASARAGVPLAAVEAKVDADIAQFVQDGPTGKELQWVKSRLELGELSQLDTLQSTAEMLNLSNVYTGDPDQYDRRWSRLEAMTTVDVQAAARRWIGTDGRLADPLSPGRVGRTYRSKSHSTAPSRRRSMRIRRSTLRSSSRRLCPTGCRCSSSAAPTLRKSPCCWRREPATWWTPAAKVAFLS